MNTLEAMSDEHPHGVRYGTHWKIIEQSMLNRQHLVTECGN